MTKRLKRPKRLPKGTKNPDLFEKVHYLVFQVTLTVLLITAASKILTSELASLKDVIITENLRVVVAYLAAVIGAGAILFSLMTVFVYLLRKRRTAAYPLKSTVIRAFIGALEQSSFKPPRSPKENEQLNS
jgi:hypothetical protein